MKRGGLRVSGGHARGIRLDVPADIRPTAERVREALFSILGDRVAGARFLDLFAGSGAVGLEAASRGAAEVVLVDADRRARGILAGNAARIGDAANVRTGRVETELPALARTRPFDLIFADPPYEWTPPEGFFSGIAANLGDGGLFILERRARGAPAADTKPLAMIDERRYGDSRLIFYSKTSGEDRAGEAAVSDGTQ